MDLVCPGNLATIEYYITRGALYMLSARNQLAGKVEEVQLGNVMAHITVQVGDNLIEGVITRRSAEQMKLKKGDSVKMIIKSTEVMVQKD